MAKVILAFQIFVFGIFLSNQLIQVSGQISEATLAFDVRNPIVYEHVLPGNQRSHFGWSTTLVETGNARSGKNYWIFVGDPMGNSTDPSYSTIKEPGVVWRCSIGTFPTGAVPECYIANIDPIDGTCEGRNYISGSCRGVKPAFEHHNENWVGGTLASNGNRLVTCAHRWHRGEIPTDRPPTEQSPLVNGLCYWFNKDTMYTDWAQSKSTVNLKKPNYGNHRLIPFFGADPMGWQYWTGSNGLANPDLAFAEAGFSIHLSQLAEGYSEVLLGAPGARLFAGSVTRYRDGGFVNGILSPGSPRLNSANQNEFSRFSSVRLPETLTDYYNSYFGYAVTSGQYFNKGETWYVGGSPRGQSLEGRVLVFQFPSGTTGRMVDFADRVRLYESPKPQFGAYFGSVLASANVDRDRLDLDELFVGAPYQKTENSAQGDSDNGAVFVFYKPILNSNNLASIMLTGSNYPRSRFGSSIASLGDINEDGFNDIAIGAPFEGPDQGGAVYIFYGKENIGNDWRFGLRISSTDYPAPLRGFGCSFSNTIDIDNNGTPDLAIGSFLSKSVAIFRTRPMLRIDAYLIFKDPRTLKYILNVESSVKNFKVEACVILSGKNLRNAIEVEISLKMDERFRRFKFNSAQGTASHIVTFKTSAPAGQDKCTEFDVEVISQDNEIGDSANIPPIAFEQFVEYKGAPVKEAPIQIFEISGNGKVNSAQNAPDQFCPSCPFPTSKSVSQELPIISDCKDINRCKPDLTMKAWFEDSDARKNVTRTELVWERKFTLWISVSNRGEPAFTPEVSVNFNSQLQKPPQFLFSSSSCQFEVGLRDKFNCSLGKLIKRNEIRLFPIPFTLDEIYAEKASAIYYVHLNAGSKTDDPKSRVVFDLTLEVISDSKVKLIGSVSSAKEIVQAGNLFHQDYTVILQGRSPVAILNFNFKFPITSNNLRGTQLLISEPQGKIICRNEGFSDFSKLNPEDDSKPGEPTPGTGGDSVSQSRRRRRETKPNPDFSQTKRIVPNENMTVWECTESGIKCLDVHCELRNFKPGVEIVSFRMKLVHNVTDEKREDKNLLLLESSGEVNLFGDASASQVDHSSKGFSQTLLRLDTALLSEGTPFWIYIVSGIGGIILLVLIMIFLYKAGFFKRATKQQLEELKAQTEIQQSIQAASRRASAMESVEQETAMN